MSATPENIHPIFDQLLTRAQKEAKLKQRARTLWFTGLSGSGKSTIAKGVEKKLFELGYMVQVLDGDNIRAGINNNLGFSEADRAENIRRIAEVSKLFIDCGIITLNCFVSPTVAMRNAARNIIGAENFTEVFINTPLEICEARDVKGLYKKARAGEIKNFTGIDAPFEPSVDPELEIETDGLSIETCVDAVVEYILEEIEFTASSK